MRARDACPFEHKGERFEKKVEPELVLSLTGALDRFQASEHARTHALKSGRLVWVS